MPEMPRKAARDGRPGVLGGRPASQGRSRAGGQAGPGGLGGQLGHGRAAGGMGGRLTPRGRRLGTGAGRGATRNPYTVAHGGIAPIEPRHADDTP